MPTPKKRRALTGTSATPNTIVFQVFLAKADGKFAVKIHAVAIGTASYATVDRSEICVRRKRTLLLRTGVDNLPFMWYIYNIKSEIHHIFKEDDFYDQRSKTKN